MNKKISQNILVAQVSIHDQSYTGGIPMTKTKRPKEFNDIPIS